MKKLNLTSLLIAECEELPTKENARMEDIIGAIHKRWSDFPLITELDENIELPAGPFMQNVGMDNGCFRVLFFKKKESVMVPLLFFVPDWKASLSIMDGFSAVMAYALELPYAFVVPSLSRNAFLDSLCEEFGLHLEEPRTDDAQLKLDRGYGAAIEMKEGWAIFDFEIVKYNGLKVCRLWSLYLISKKDFIETSEIDRAPFLEMFGLNYEG